MRLHEAIEKVKTGDEVQSDGNGGYPAKVSFKLNRSGVAKTRSGDTFTFCRAHFLWDWEVIPEKPKLITAEDYIMETAITSEVEMQDIKDAFKAGEKNQWTNHAELKEVCERYVDRCGKDGFMKEMFREALKNIKPLT